MPPTLTAIVAMTPDRIIGRNGTLPWHLPADLAFFKRTTLGHPVVMGRKTWDSIGKPLPRRRNIVLTRDRTLGTDGAEAIHSPEELTSLLGEHTRQAFIIGGADIYAAFLPWLDEIIVSHLNVHHHGDTYFPAFEEKFPESEIIETHPEFIVRRWLRGKRS